QKMEITDQSITFSTNIPTFPMVAPVVEIPIEKNEIRINADIPGASIYLDGKNTGKFVPAILNNIPDGLHEIKLFNRDAFRPKELFIKVEKNGASGLYVEANFRDISTEKRPIVTFDRFLHGKEIVTETDSIKISGQVTLYDSGGFHAYGPARGVICQYSNPKGISIDDTYFAVDKDGKFQFTVKLLDDLTYLVLRVNGPTGATGKSEILSLIKKSKPD
ncbi:MAG: PEGA domain-containing protein, partial [Oligoflexales bacterium]|nr:PEGA domain-containing protein [Oligoflexales bacterium]